MAPIFCTDAATKKTRPLCVAHVVVITEMFSSATMFTSLSLSYFCCCYLYLQLFKAKRGGGKEEEEEGVIMS